MNLHERAHLQLFVNPEETLAHSIDNPWLLKRNVLKQIVWHQIFNKSPKAILIITNPGEKIVITPQDIQGLRRLHGEDPNV